MKKELQMIKNIIITPLYWTFSTFSNIMVYGMFFILGLLVKDEDKFKLREIVND
jgi:hypothetical protein